MAFFYLLLSFFSAQKALEYNYDDSTPLGPNNWATLYEEECSRPRQSPIDIDTSNFVPITNPDACEEDYFLDFDFDHRRFQVTNGGKGFTITAIDDMDPPNFLNTNTNTIAEIKNVLLTEHPEYCFDSLHFHFGADVNEGSEHFLDGEQYPIEAHFVFYSCQYANLGDAVNAHLTSEDPDTEILAVIGILFDVEEDSESDSDEDDDEESDSDEDDTISNLSFQPLVDNINDINEPGESTIIEIDFSQFFGGRRKLGKFIRNVYIYEGSLTTPACFQAVLWHVSSKVLKISQSQLDKLYTVRYDEDGNGASFGMFGNFRPIQPLNGRYIYRLECPKKD